MKTRSYQAGEFILQQGEIGHEAYRILSGRVEIFVQKENRKVVLGQLGRDEIIGEMGMIGDKPRSASAVALEKTDVEVVTPQEFNEMILRDPNTLLPYLKSFFERLRNVTESYSSLAPSLTESPAHKKSTPQIRLLAQTDSLRQKIPKPEWIIDKFPFRIGRWSEHAIADVFISNDLLIKDEKPYQISRNHCAIGIEGAQFYLLDRGSSYGTRVNGLLVGGPETQVVNPLHPGKNEIQLGGRESPYIFHLFVE